MIKEEDFRNKMIELIQNGIEYVDQVKCVFFTWVEFFDKDEVEALEMATCIANKADSDHLEDIVEDLLSVLVED